MSFFKRKDKKLAKECTYNTLQEGYRQTEIGLKKACASGDEKAIRKDLTYTKEQLENFVKFNVSANIVEKQGENYIQIENI